MTKEIHFCLKKRRISSSYFWLHPQIVYILFVLGVSGRSPEPLYFQLLWEHYVYDKTLVAFPVSLMVVHGRYSNKKAW